ncbi:DUF4174 domain-containing protein [Pontibacter ramchanderi]|uniref:Uncharacterized protein DUF4174 n=1 Tax=Pontibacter ramchanderi TaxID=1179743 RepID=A0A2N3UC32_9BACT|nr:DUF4174 domain-containing protein [Pontibacter ramchanderi]PKV66901.1 uncharacterized protein DUF4174 [Pontibacter ramchanderi]
MGKLFLNITVLCCLCSIPFATQAQNKREMDLEIYKWEKRLLLLFAPAMENTVLVSQQEMIRKSQSGIAERQLEVLELVPGGNAANMRENLLRKFGVEAGSYTLLLLGKDGLEKYRSQKAVPLEEVFKIIDQMPMRRREMRKQD